MKLLGSALLALGLALPPDLHAQALLSPAPGASYGNGDLLNIEGRVQKLATGALAIVGMAVVPNETASTLSLSGGDEESYDYTGGQLGGAFTVGGGVPIYLEGFLGYSRYDPVFIITDGAVESILPVKWTTVAATGGVGYDFALSDRLVLRPIANISLGYVVSDTAVLGHIIDDALGTDLQFLKEGQMLAGGVGASIMLDYEHSFDGYTIDSELRYTYIHLETILRSSSLGASSDAQTLGWWNRLRVPTSLMVMRRPVRAVFEASASLYPGDQGELLHTEWMVQVGAGIELNFEDTIAPISTGRLVARYAVGESLTGFSIGLAASF